MWVSLGPCDRLVYRLVLSNLEVQSCLDLVAHFFGGVHAHEFIRMHFIHELLELDVARRRSRGAHQCGVFYPDRAVPMKEGVEQPRHGGQVEVVEEAHQRGWEIHQPVAAIEMRESVQLELRTFLKLLLRSRFKPFVQHKLCKLRRSNRVW